MNKNSKENITRLKGLKSKGLVYFTDDLEADIEPNYQLLALLIENINIEIGRDLYCSLNGNEENLINELALLTFKDEDLISDADIEFKENLIKMYIDVSNPVLICGSYCFLPKFNSLEVVYDKALKQIKDGKFKNYIF